MIGLLYTEAYNKGVNPLVSESFYFESAIACRSELELASTVLLNTFFVHKTSSPPLVGGGRGRVIFSCN